jgi:diacylglycerol kinase (ATP)
MRRVALIYNPASGQLSPRRAKLIEEALGVLRDAGVEAEALETYAPGSAGVLAAEAVSRGCDTILACGGDGTVHEILQCLVGTPTALGVVPLGTANALAADLGLWNGIGASAAQTIHKLLEAVPQKISVGHISYQDTEGATHSHYFTVAAGVGADALLMSQLDAKLKRRFGYFLYLWQGLWIWATHSFPLFNASFEECKSCKPRVEAVSQLLAVRIRNFGGVLHNLAPGATLHSDGLRLIAFKTRNRWSYLQFVVATVFRRQTFTRDIELLDAVSVECHPRNGSSARIFAEADGELLGVLPVKIEIVPQALTLLIPRGAQP